MSATPTIDVIDFARFCGPRSLAAVLAPVSRFTTARILMDVMRHRGGLLMLPGTDNDTMVIALHVVGCRAEAFDTSSGERIEDADQCLARARAATPRRGMAASEMRAAVQEVIDASSMTEQARLAEYWRRRHDGKRLLRDWTMPGTWLVESESDVCAHWIALRDGVAISDDAGFSDSPVLTALRVQRGLMHD